MISENQLLAEHSRGYRAFVRMAMYSTLAVIATLGLMAIFLL